MPQVCELEKSGLHNIKRMENGESAYTVKKFGVVNRYDLSEEFPIMTLRRTAIKSSDEMLWI